MIEKQRTISQAVSFSGIGLHTGNPSVITFHPAPENYGYRFIRTDIPDQIEIHALVDNVVDLSRGTTLGINGIKVHTVEHVLAALSGLQIDNCRIELTASEPPVGDGSSLPYVEVLLKAGFTQQSQDREYFVIEETIRYTNEVKAVDIVALPLDDYRLTVMIDYFNPVLGSQHTGLFNLEKEFVIDYAPARTFCFLSEIEMLRDQGLIKGGTLDSALVIVDKELDESELKKIKEMFGYDSAQILAKNGILNNSELRFKNEPARHKLLDMLGDLALVGVPLKAQILAARPGHASNFEFAKKIRNLYKKKMPLKKYKVAKSSDAIFNITDLMKFMPHRYPFLLVDKVIEFDSEAQTIVGVKNVTFNEPYFIGHFPEKPIMPGVLILEALAQTGCLLLLSSLEDVSKVLVVFQAIKNAKFRKPVIPGDQIIMEVKLVGKKLNIFFFQGTAYVNGSIVAEAELQATMLNKDAY
jgi:UDP-3-O-[3-hydroxymyristoyl] N-acetylglucosamine deacetylase / 3-hydroxyacyl-[acyl-carrier-protein] dehydratase